MADAVPLTHPRLNAVVMGVAVAREGLWGCAMGPGRKARQALPDSLSAAQAAGNGLLCQQRLSPSGQQ